MVAPRSTAEAGAIYSSSHKPPYSKFKLLTLFKIFLRKRGPWGQWRRFPWICGVEQVWAVEAVRAHSQAWAARSRAHREPQLLCSDICCPILMEATLPTGCSCQWERVAGTQRQVCSLEKQESWDSSLWLLNSLVEINFPLNFSLRCFHPIASFLSSLLTQGQIWILIWWLSQPPLDPSPFSLIACFSQGPDKHRHLLDENCPLFHWAAFAHVV